MPRWQAVEPGTTGGGSDRNERQALSRCAEPDPAWPARPTHHDTPSAVPDARRLRRPAHEFDARGLAVSIPVPRPFPPGEIRAASRRIEHEPQRVAQDAVR